MIKITQKAKRIILRAGIFLVSLMLMAIITLLSVSTAMVKRESERILTQDKTSSLSAIDCIIVLGAKVKSNGAPSDMLRDRLDTAIALYKAGVSPKLLMSGDHGSVGYNEVGIMKKYALDAGVPESDIFMDHAGFSTYETMYRAREVFLSESRFKRVLIVTQEYHLYRALYIANYLGLDAYGVAADLHTYRGQTARDVRELAARLKDFMFCLYEAKPKYLGEPISIYGDGNVTNDKYYSELFG